MISNLFDPSFWQNLRSKFCFACWTQLPKIWWSNHHPFRPLPIVVPLIMVWLNIPEFSSPKILILLECVSQCVVILNLTWVYQGKSVDIVQGERSDLFLSRNVHALAILWYYLDAKRRDCIVISFHVVFMLQSLFVFTLVCQLKKALNMEALHKDLVAQIGCSRCSSRPKGYRVSRCMESLFFKDRRQVCLSHYSKI